VGLQLSGGFGELGVENLSLCDPGSMVLIESVGPDEPLVKDGATLDVRLLLETATA